MSVLVLWKYFDFRLEVDRLVNSYYVKNESISCFVFHCVQTLPDGVDDVDHGPRGTQ